MIPRNRSFLLFVAIAWMFGLPAAFAHIGSPTAFYDGNAGPYQVRVIIQPPQVVPGRAQINVRVQNGPVSSVTALPVRWDAGRKGAPAPDPALPVPGATNLFSTELWLMNSGAYSVFVDVEGPLGNGTAIVPLNSLASRRLSMPRWMGGIFLGAGLALAILLVWIIAAAAREGALNPGSPVDRSAARRGRYGMALGSLVLVLALMKGNAWWNQVDAKFKNDRLFKPVEVPVRVQTRDGQRFLTVTIESPEEGWRDNSPLVADHGKLMHLFLIGSPGMEAFAHLHPTQTGGNEFDSPVPQLPPGDYTVYADVTHETGLQQTYVGKLALRAGNVQGKVETRDPDDSWWGVQKQEKAAKAADAPLQNGGFLRALIPLEAVAGEELTLRFEAIARDGKPLPLEPYLGMWSHAVVAARDGSVFAHIHPAGTISMTSQELFARRERGESLRKPIDVTCGRPERDLTFPYAFPKPGEYRVWVQVRSGGEVLTGAFDFHVLPKRA